MLMKCLNRTVLGLLVVSLCLSAGVSRGEGQLWETDFEGAKARAKKENKLLLVDFTGSDWCTFCFVLKREVFDTDVFKDQAPKQFVLVELDFPRMKVLPEGIKERNAKLLQQYGVTGYPTLLLLDADGNKLAKTGYRRGSSPTDYMSHLTELVTTHQQIAATKTKLANVQGIERAKLLDEIVSGSEKLGLENGEDEKYGQEIVALDAENKAGLKSKYLVRGLNTEAAQLKRARKMEAAMVVYEKILVTPGLSAEQKQTAHFNRGECHYMLKDFAGVIRCLNQAREAAPESAQVSNIDVMLKRFTPMADAQAAFAGVKKELDTAAGLDRARVLDRLIDAQTKLNKLVPDPKSQKNIQEWAEQIVMLDGDNAAGLKVKYEPMLEKKEPKK